MENNYIVYLHKNIINGKVYVGQTNNLSRRWRGDGIDYQKSSYFFKAIQKYGWDNFEHLILKEHLAKEEADQWEVYYIDFYDSQNHEKGYNIRCGGSNGALAEETKKKLSQIAKEKELWQGDNNPRHKDPLFGERNGMYGKHHSEETKQKISESKKGTLLSEGVKQKISQTLKEKHPRSKKVLCIETGEIYPSARQAAEAIGVPHTCISRVCNGQRKTSGGYHWKYLVEEEKNNDINK